MLYSQRSPAYAHVEVGRSGKSIEQIGCLLCCFSSIVEVSPPVLNAALTAVDGYTPDGRIIWERLRQVVPYLYIRADEDFANRPFTARDATALATWLEAEPGRRWAVLNVNLNPLRGGRANHWVLVTGVDVPEVPPAMRAVPSLWEKFAYPQVRAYDPYLGVVTLVNHAYAPPYRNLDYAVWRVLRVELNPLYVALDRDPLDITPEAAEAICHDTPLAPVSRAVYDAIRARGIAAAVGLAFCQHESRFGQEGVAVRTHNFGNLRKGPRADRHADGWAWYERRPGEQEGWEWVRSAEDWADLIRAYIADGLEEVGAILLRYAPSADGNHPLAYADAVRAQVDAWTSREGWARYDR